MSTMAHVFNNLCSDESMPDCITFHKNGTTTVLMKNRTDGGEVYYTGTPSFKDKNGRTRHGEHPLVLSADGRIEGTYALNSIVVGGWMSWSKDPGDEERQKIREILQSTLVTYAVLTQQGTESNETSLEDAIRSETGFDVIKKPMTDEDKLLMAAMEFKNHMVDLLERRGWSLNITPRHLVRRLGSYCELVQGSWTDEARKIATTSALPYSTVSCLKTLGLTLRKVKRSSRKKTARNQ